MSAPVLYLASKSPRRRQLLQQLEIEFETVHFRAQLARALAGEGDPPRLEFRNA